METLKGHYQKAQSVKKSFPKPVPTEQYEQEPGPKEPTRMQRFESEHQIISGAAHRVKDAAVGGAAWMQKRGQEINRPNSYRGTTECVMSNPFGTLPRDPFGVGRAGNPFASGPMIGPFMDQAGPIRREPAPRRKKRRRQRDYDDEPQSRAAPMFADPFHIPKSMRHLF